MPKRIQQRRTRGWRLPENAVVVSRPSVFGNPFVIGKPEHPLNCPNAKEAVRGFRRYVKGTAVALQIHPNLRELNAEADLRKAWRAMRGGRR